MGIFNNISAIKTWSKYNNKIKTLKDPSKPNPNGNIAILKIQNTFGGYFELSLRDLFDDGFTFHQQPASVEFVEPDIYSLLPPDIYFMKNVTATMNGEDVDFYFEIIEPEPEPETNEDEEWWAMMTALGRA